MRPAPKCLIDRTRPCGACIAPSPQECPYAYLLDPDELAAVAAAGPAGADQPPTASEPTTSPVVIVFISR
jgi:hypothetical protein